MERLINPYLTIALTVQPTIIQTLGERQAFAGNGALERFLYVIPKSKLGYRTHDKPPVSPSLQQAYSNKIKTLLDIPQLFIDNREQPHVLTLSPEAQTNWQAFQAQIEVQLRPEGKLALCQGWGAKICGFALRIAGLLHIAEHGWQNLIINQTTMENALTIATTYYVHPEIIAKFNK